MTQQANLKLSPFTTDLSILINKNAVKVRCHGDGSTNFFRLTEFSVNG